MKSILLSCVCALFLAACSVLPATAETPPATAPAVADYEITINGEKQDLVLDHDIKFTTKSGEVIVIHVKRKDILTYADPFVTFKYPGGLSVARKDLGDGIQQIVQTTAAGTLFLVQEYTGLDPSSLTELMLNELTKENVNYGYKLKKTPITKTLSDKTVMKGIEGVLTYKGTESTYVVLAFAKKDQGIIVVTQIDRDDVAAEGPFLQAFWDSLKVNF